MTHAGHNQPKDERLDTLDPPCPGTRFRNPDAYEALVHAWDILRLLVGRVGMPYYLWIQCTMRQWQRFAAFDLLRPIEMMLRRILLIEALALAPELPEPKPAKPRASRERKLTLRDMDNPTAWRAPFRNLQPAGRPQRRRAHRPYEPHGEIGPRQSGTFVSSWLLARRIEAAIRVSRDPLPWIRRLAHRIRRRGTPDLSRLPKPQRIRYPRALATLHPLEDALGMQRTQRVDSS